MKNITVSVAEEVHRQARIHAARHGTSVSALVRDYLLSLTAEPGLDPGDDPRRLAQDELFRRLDQEGQGLSAADRQPRSLLHERLA
jgi:plasmid stability protein